MLGQLAAAAVVLAATHIVPPVIPPEGPRRVIVEFAGQPAVYTRNASSQRGTHARFRADLHELHRVASQSVEAPPPAPRIRREYSVAFLGAVVEMTRGQIAAVRGLPYVRAVHDDRVVYALGGPVKPHTPLLSDARLRVNAGHLTARGEGITVAVIDTGIDYKHPSLGGGFGPGFKVAGGWDFANNDPDPMDDNSHGTHVAGIIAADSMELIGVAPKATLYAYKVLGAGGAGSFSDVIAGIERCVDPNGDGDPSDHVDVANISLGGIGTADDPQSRAVDNAVAAGVIMCVAAGNSGGFARIDSPGAAPRAITVGAIQDDGRITTFTSRGPTARDLHFKPDVAAPGHEIPSSIRGGGFADFSGTSMAAPHVAGVCALLLELHPDWTPEDVKAALTSTATSISGTPFARGAGRVDAGRAASATSFVSVSGLSFGLDAVNDPVWEATRSFVLTNRGAVERLYSVDSGSTYPGLALSVEPATATIAPGTSQRFDVRLVADNVSLGFPQVNIAPFGTVQVTSSGETTTIPWAVIRSARITIEYDSFWLSPLGYANGREEIEYPRLYAADRAEAFVPGNLEWEFLVVGYDVPEDPNLPPYVRLVSVPRRRIDGDALIRLSRDDAPHAIELDARDEEGRRLGLLPETPFGKPATVRHHTVLRLQRDGRPAQPVYIGRRELFYASDLPHYRIDVHEMLLDTASLRFFNVRHDSLDDVSGPATLTKHAGSYVKGRFDWPFRGDRTLNACSYVNLREGNESFPYLWTCLLKRIEGPLAIDYFTTAESAGNGAFTGLSLSTEGTRLPLLRAQDGKMVASESGRTDTSRPRACRHSRRNAIGQG